MNSLFEDLVQIQRESMTVLKKINTHCMDLKMEIIKSSSEHFEIIDLHYENGGLLCSYLCNLDGKTYNVHITPQ